MNESGTFIDQTKLIGLDLQDKFVTRGVARADIDNETSTLLYLIIRKHPLLSMRR